MGESLYTRWLEEEVDDLQLTLLSYGISGILAEFEEWLERSGYLKR